MLPLRNLTTYSILPLLWGVHSLIHKLLLRNPRRTGSRKDLCAHSMEGQQGYSNYWAVYFHLLTTALLPLLSISISCKPTALPWPMVLLQLEDPSGKPGLGILACFTSDFQVKYRNLVLLMNTWRHRVQRSAPFCIPSLTKQAKASPNRHASHILRSCNCFIKKQTLALRCFQELWTSIIS